MYFCHFIVKLAEEILHDSRAHWLSDDNRYIAYLQFNDTNVPLELFPVYNDPTDVYGGISEVSYPKVWTTVLCRLFVALAFSAQ
jgi:hypothetical protein